MAQLKDTLVSGNLRVTDTILADILQADSIKGGIVATGTTWNGNTIDEIYGGTGQNTYTKGDLLYASAANTLSKLGANTGTKKFLSMTSSVPSWASIAFADIPSLYIGTTKVQSSSAAQALTGITTLTTSGNATIGGTVTVGSGGLIGSGSASQIYLSNSSGIVFVVDGKVVRRNGNITDITLGSSNYRWGGLYSTTGSFSSTLGVTGNTTLGGTLSVTGLSTLSGGITLGGTYNNTSSNLVWDSDHSAWHLIGNFYADGFVSAGGLSTGSGTSGIDWSALATNDSSHKIHVSHMPYVAGTTSDLTTGTSTTGTIWAAKTIADYVQSQVNTSVTSALYFRGESSTAITNGGTETATIDGSSLTAKTGDLVLYNGKEFAWDGSKWIQFGDESSWAAKTVKIEGTGYLSGGGTLESNRTIDIGSTYKTKIDNGATAYGYFSNNILPVSHGGTGKSTWTQYGIVYASASGTLAQIALPTWAASTTYWLKAVTNSSKVPTYSLATLSKSDVGLGNVENTALSTWTGTNKITTVGTVTTGTWNATAISAKYGGTGMSGDNAFTGAYRIVYTSSATAMTTLAPNTTSTKKFLTMTGTGSAGQAPAWGTVTKSDVGLGNVANSTYAGGTAVTLNGTSKASSTASFYAPTASGTVSEVLLSGGANTSPTWAKQSSLSTGFHPRALTSKGTTATTTAGETYGVAGDSTSGKRIFTKWFVNLDSGDTTLVDGMIITFRIPLAGLGTVGECITIDGNEQHFHQVVYGTNSLLTTHFAVNSVITVQYDSTISSSSYGKYDSSTGTYVHNGNTTTAIKGVWRVLSLYDSGNTDVRYQQTFYYINWSVPTDGAIRAYTLCMETPDGKFTSLTTVNSSTGTSKAMYSGYLKPRKVYYWAHTDNYSGGGTITRSNVMLTFNGGLIDYRYTLNCGTTLTAKSPLYLVGTIDNNGFKLDTTKPWSCTLPTTEDGKVYIYVGMTYDTYRGSLEENNTIYWYKDGAVRVYNYHAVKAETATKLSTVSKTAWGQTYWTSNGVPDNISGNMSSVGSISMSGSISGATTGSFSSNVTVGGTLTVGTATANKATTLNGTLSVTGLSTLAGGAKLTTTKKIWFGDTYYLELNSNGLHTNAGFYSDSFVSAGGLSDGSGTSGIDLDAMWQSLKNTSDSHGSDKIAVGHIPDLSGTYQTKYGFTITGTSGASYNLANFVTSSGVTSVATGTGLTGGTITSTGTISINSTYQTYISHGNTAYGWGNHASAGYLLASTAASTYVSSVTINGDYLRVTKNGGNADLTIPYASRAGYVDGTNTGNWDANSPGNNQYLWFYGQEGGVSNFPNDLVGSYGSIVNFLSLGSSGSLHAQLAWGINHDSTNASNGIAWRAKNNLGWDTTWHRLYDDNYHPTADNASTLNGQPGSYYAAASSLSSYLPLTGGTLTGQLAIGGDTILYFYGVENVSYDYTIDNRTGFGLLFKSTYEQDQGVLFSDYGDVTARKFIKRDGTSAQFLKADGTVDGTSYLPLTGGTLTGSGSNDVLINLNTETAKSWIGFRPSDGTFRYLGINNSNELLFQYNSSSYTVYHSGNSNNFNTNWDAKGLRVGGQNGYHDGYGLEIYYTNDDFIGSGGVSVVQSYGRGAAYGDSFYPLRISGSKIVLTSGNVGINEANPSHALDVNGDFHTSGNIYIEQSGGIYCGPSGSQWRKIYGCDSDGGTYTRMASYAMLPDNDSNDCWQVRPWNGGYSSAYITVLQGGNVGIGTNSPAYKLDVSGIMRSTYLVCYHGGQSENAGYVGCGSSNKVIQVVANSGYSIALNGDAVGIGTNSPAYTLDVNGSIGCSTLTASMGVTVSGGALHITNTAGAQIVLGGYGTQGSSAWSQDGNPCLEFLNGTGYIDWHYYGSSNDYTSRIIEGSSGVLTLYGSWVATGAITAGSASDIRLKTNIQTLSTDSAKDIILKARPVNFTWKDIATELYDGYKGNDIGLIAQEVEDLLPQAIGTIFEKYKRLDYTKFIPPIITVIQDHEKRIKELEDIIAKLTEENKYLKEQI